MKPNQELIDIYKKIKEAENKQPWDRRTKAHKDGEKKIKILGNQAKQIIAEKALQRVKDALLARYTCCIADDYEGPHVRIEVFEPTKYEEGFRWYLRPHFNTWGSWPSASYDLYTSTGRFSSGSLSDTDKNYIKVLYNKLDVGLKGHVENKRTEEKNKNNSDALYQATKDILSYKDYNGERFEYTFEDKADSWHSSAKTTVETRKAGYDIDTRLTWFTKSLNDCVGFIAEFEGLVKKYTNYIKKKEKY